MNRTTDTIKTLRLEHVKSIVAVHLFCFPGFFLTFLGPRFLTLFYQGICSAKEGIGFVYLNASGEPAGFVVGTTNPRGFYSRLLKRYWFKFCSASVLPILKRPAIFSRVARALLHPSENPPDIDIAGLFSIGVLPELQGTGAGKLLVYAFLNEARLRGCRQVFLTTDRDENDSVNAFYWKLGFSIERQYITPEGRHMNEYRINLN